VERGGGVRERRGRGGGGEGERGYREGGWKRGGVGGCNGAGGDRGKWRIENAR
jgi:hypothetical protein